MEGVLSVELTVRALEKEDYEDLAVLMEELGYPAPVAEVAERFDQLDKLSDYASLVVVKNGKAVGFSGLCRMHYFELNGTYTRILAFVVSSAVRKQGVGSILLKASEQWAVEHGCNGITLNSGNRPERQAAHAFYTANGYSAKSTGFSKTLR
jgi:GNAT superfamily N-acetyltransferase